MNLKSVQYIYGKQTTLFAPTIAIASRLSEESSRLHVAKTVVWLELRFAADLWRVK